MMSATSQSHPVQNTERRYNSLMAGVVQSHPNSYTSENQARRMYAKYTIDPWPVILIIRTLFEHTRRQYARMCNRLIRQGQFQQQDPEKQQPNGVR
jgi:hypothetical protein